MKEIISTGKTIEEAIAGGLKELDTARENVEVEILETPVKGIFGLIGAKDAKIKLTKIEDPAKTLQDFLEQLMDKMRIEASVLVTKDDNRLSVSLSGESMGLIIGRRGETLDAIQQLAQLYMNKEFDRFYKVAVDTESYREKREEALINLADGLAKKVMRTKKEIVLEPMKSYERRVIHTALQGYNKIITKSVGSEPNRKIVISYRFSNKSKKENEK